MTFSKRFTEENPRFWERGPMAFEVWISTGAMSAAQISGTSTNGFGNFSSVMQ
jgi:hypothetical protein